MDVINKVIKCAVCNETLENPVLIQCGELICKKHSNEKVINCLRCGQCHEFTGEKAIFQSVNAIERLLNAKFDQLQLGNVYESAKEGCTSLENSIEEFEAIKKDPDNCIYEEVNRLKTLVEIKREQLKNEIDEKARVLIDDLEGFRIECSNHTQEDQFKQNLNLLEKTVANGKTVFESSFKKLQILKFDEEGWTQIMNDCLLAKSEIVDEMGNFRLKELLLDKFKIYQEKQLHFDSYELKNFSFTSSPKWPEEFDHEVLRSASEIIEAAKKKPNPLIRNGKREGIMIFLNETYEYELE